MPVGDTAHFKDPAVDAEMKAAVLEVNHDKRLAAYKKIQAQILDGAPWVFVNSTLLVRATRKNVEGLTLSPTQMFFDMEQVSLKK